MPDQIFITSGWFCCPSQHIQRRENVVPLKRNMFQQSPPPAPSIQSSLWHPQSKSLEYQTKSPKIPEHSFLQSWFSFHNTKSNNKTATPQYFPRYHLSPKYYYFWEVQCLFLGQWQPDHNWVTSWSHLPLCYFCIVQNLVEQIHIGIHNRLHLWIWRNQFCSETQMQFRKTSWTRILHFINARAWARIQAHTFAQRSLTIFAQSLNAMTC